MVVDNEQLALDDALEQVEAHANPNWIDYAKHIVREVARTNQTFIVDAVWEAGLGKPSEARAMGAVMVWARKAGLIEPTDDFRTSMQAGCHRMPRRVWRSRIFEIL